MIFISYCIIKTATKNSERFLSSQFYETIFLLFYYENSVAYSIWANWMRFSGLMGVIIQLIRKETDSIVEYGVFQINNRQIKV